MHFLITAGGTREYIDAVRFISNASSGKTGYALCRSALEAGHKVTLITTISDSKFQISDSGLEVVKVETAARMFEAVKKFFPRCDCLIMAAAVADYTPARPAKTKIRKTAKPMTLKLKPTEDILKWAGRNKKKKQIVVGFALEDKNLRANAEKKLKEKNLDMIIVNTPTAIGAEKVKVQIKMPRGKWLRLPKTGKAKVAGRIVALIEKIKFRSGKATR